MASMKHFESIFSPESVAVIGASNDLEKWGGGVFNSVRRAAIDRIYPVNKSADEIQGIKAYPSVRDIPDTVEFAVIVVPFPAVPDIVKDCVAKGVKAALIITAGLGEVGGEGLRLQEEIVRTAREGGMRLIGPNCMGHFNTGAKFSTVRMGMPIEPGEIGIISESGGFSAHILQIGTEMGMGFSKFVSTGNEADLHFEDFVEYFAQDDATKVITAYIEGLREGRRFFEMAKKFTRDKPMVVVKVGKTEAGARAARSHTSAIAGSDLVYDAMFKQAGVIRVNEVEELFDVASALLSQPLPKGNRVGILTFGGGFGCVASDACEKLGLEVAPLSGYTIEKLNAVLPDRWPHANPVDTVGYGAVTFPCLWPMLEEENFDALLVIGGIGGWGRRRRVPPDAQPEELPIPRRRREEQENIERLFAEMEKSGKPIIAFNHNATIMDDHKGHRMATYPTPDRAAKVLAHLVDYARYKNSL